MLVAQGKTTGDIIRIPVSYTHLVNNPCIVPYEDRWLLTEPSCDTVYTYSSAEGLKPFIVRTPSIQSMSPEIFLFPGVVTDRYCFMQTVKKELNLAMMDRCV